MSNLMGGIHKQFIVNVSKCIFSHFKVQILLIEAFLLPAFTPQYVGGSYASMFHVNLN